MDVSYIESLAGRRLTKQELVDLMTTAVLEMQTADGEISVADAVDLAIEIDYKD